MRYQTETELRNTSSVGSSWTNTKENHTDEGNSPSGRHLTLSSASTQQDPGENKHSIKNHQSATKHQQTEAESERRPNKNHSSQTSCRHESLDVTTPGRDQKADADQNYVQVEK